MIQFEQFDFASPPFTAADIFVDTLLRAGFKLVGNSANLAALAATSFNGDANRLRVSLVRHPYDWLRSYYTCERTRITKKTFDEFVLAYVQKAPGTISQMFDRYAADTCLRVEDFPAAIAEFMESLGVSSMLNRTILLDSNTSNNELRRRVVEAEKEYCEHYDYWG